jgi:hypothetical protein
LRIAGIADIAVRVSFAIQGELSAWPLFPPSLPLLPSVQKEFLEQKAAKEAKEFRTAQFTLNSIG